MTAVRCTGRCQRGRVVQKGGPNSMLVFVVGIAVPIWLAWGETYIRAGSAWWVVAVACALFVSAALAMSFSTVAGRPIGVRAVGLLGCGLAAGCAIAAVVAFVGGRGAYGAAFLVVAVTGFLVQFTVGTFLEQSNRPAERMSRVRSQK